MENQLTLSLAPAKSRAADLSLTTVWLRLQRTYFPNDFYLLEYSVVWSARRQKRVLASCNIQKRLVRVATELKTPACGEWIEPLLYHEMCHAALEAYYKKRRGRVPWHGRAFRDLELRHPRSLALDHWIRSGGWMRAVRSARAKARWRRFFNY